ncbi:fumarylacetoacetate hydrolase family protein [Cohnella terricola]|uniref:Fumarylacetoacetate hydrolase family protein n=1 Tax=Cohnella terricola TaxID=1289167 RepID=A0A559JWK5_9BACL|nr:fumarylacetoacetate hydrolase family protein [Cohnella terricola]TVY04275.1 fumarylacetoacetate hydrolase family protein [Cohnella terricola]
MKILTFHKGQGTALGIRTDRGIIDVEQAAAAFGLPAPATLKEVLAGGDAARRELERLVEAVGTVQGDWLLEEERIVFAPCVPDPGKIICVGLNYRKHAEETNAAIPNYPVLFNKFSNTIAAHGDDIEIPRTTSQLDYEAELIIVIGQKTKYVSKDEALDHVFGYCCVNDLSARDLQMRTPQWMLGKIGDGFSPIGPYVVTADEVGNPNQLAIRSIVNGEVRQQSNTSDMIFPCDEIVSYISQHLTLEPGDLILTGTPEGVVLGYPPEKQVYLKPGDIVTIEIEKLGALTNRFVAEAQ